MKVAAGLATALLLSGVGLAPAAAPLTGPATAAAAETRAVQARDPGRDDRRPPGQREVDELARDVERVQAVREVKDVQWQFAQLRQHGRFGEMSRLFTRAGTLQWGDETATGHRDIAAWLRQDAGAMDGRRPGSLHTELADNPIVNLSADGRTAQARWSVLRLMGDGDGGTRIEGGIYENEYAREHGRWRITRLQYHPQLEGDYENAWTNHDGEQLPIVPYHFTPDTAGVPIPEPVGDAPRTHLSARQLAGQVQQLNDEDDVRNLQHSYGYYVDRRMWDDVVDLFDDRARVRIRGEGTFHGPDGVRRAMEQTMGPEGLVQRTLNEHPIFNTVVDVLPGGKRAVTRGFQLGLLEEPTTRAAAWEFAVFRNTFVKEDGLWKLHELDVTPLLRASYDEGWGHGGDAAARHPVPAFVDTSRTATGAGVAGRDHPDLDDLTRRLARSAAYDGAVNANSVYTSYLDDNNCVAIGQIHAEQGFKSSPGAGFYLGKHRITEACAAFYGHEPPTSRVGVSFHWVPQPVVLVSHDGRSARTRERLINIRSGQTQDNPFYRSAIAGGMYNNQVVLEDGVWRLWDTTIDEQYWGMNSWQEGWAGVEPRDPDAPPEPPRDLIEDYPPDLLLSDMGERERGQWGGIGRRVYWPDIMQMWFNHRNLVSGRTPDHFQPDCTPCGVRPGWSMTAHGYQAPPDGPSVDGIPVS